MMKGSMLLMGLFETYRIKKCVCLKHFSERQRTDMCMDYLTDIKRYKKEAKQRFGKVGE